MRTKKEARQCRASVTRRSRGKQCRKRCYYGVTVSTTGVAALGAAGSLLATQTLPV